MIPKIIHQIWLTDKNKSPIPDKYLQFIETWKIQNPDFEHKLWGREVFDEFGGLEAFWEKYNLDGVHPAQISDVVRLKLLDKFGGIYADIDVECFKSVEPFLDNKFWCYMYGYTNQNIMLSFDTFGAEPGNELVQEVMRQIDDNIKVEGMDLLWKYGFRRFQDIVLTCADKDTTLYGLRQVAPYFKHHFFNSWCKENKSFNNI